MALETHIPKQNPSEPIGEGGAAKKNDSETPPLLRPELQIPQAAIDAYRTARDKSRRLDWCRLWVEVLTLLAVAGYGIVAYLQWLSMGKSVDASKQALVATQRPWVSADIRIDGPLFFSDSGAGIQLKISLKNTGLTPATNVLPFPIMFVREPQPINVLAIQKRRCNTVRQPSRPSGGSGYTLFPGHVIDEYNTPSVAQDEIEGTRLIGPFIISCINYQFTFSGESHQTAAMYSLVRLDPAHPGQAFAINPRGGPVPAASLRLIPMGSYAD